jgi:condensin-2 complex subunit G2
MTSNDTDSVVRTEEESSSFESQNNATIVRRALFAAIEESDHDTAFIRLFQSSNHCGTLLPGLSTKQQRSLILATVQGFHKGHARRFFSGVKTIVEGIVSEEAFIPESACYAEGEEDHRQEEIDFTDITPDTKSTEALQFLKYSAMCVDAYLDGRKPVAVESSSKQTSKQQKPQQLSIIAQVYDVALDLHNVLFSLQSCGAEGTLTLNTILSLCENWWHANGANRENLIVQCLPLVVLQTMDGDNNLQKSQVKRLFQLRDAFQVIDFANPSSDALRSLLLRVASNPLCLSMPEGKRFLAALFQEPLLVSDLHIAIRAQIPEARKTVLTAYGEIYFKAWKDAADAPEEIREAIEHEALQDLMHGVIHVASPATHKSILTLLEPIHEHAKKSPEMEGLLFRLYGPILWRSLSVANPRVRCSAMAVLAQVFPLQDPSHTQTQVAIAKGTSALKSALKDADPRVRVAGSEATAKICAFFWSALPAADIRMLLNRTYIVKLRCHFFTPIPQSRSYYFLLLPVLF